LDLSLAIEQAHGRREAMSGLCDNVVAVTHTFESLKEKLSQTGIGMIDAADARRNGDRLAFFAVGWSKEIIEPFSRFGKVTAFSKENIRIEPWRDYFPFPRSPENQDKETTGIAMATFNERNSTLSATITRLNWLRLEKITEFDSEHILRVNRDLAARMISFRYVPGLSTFEQEQGVQPGPRIDVIHNFSAAFSVYKGVRPDLKLLGRTTLAPWHIDRVVDTTSMRQELEKRDIHFSPLRE
jgi:hypothetical protein